MNDTWLNTWLGIEIPFKQPEKWSPKMEKKISVCWFITWLGIEISWKQQEKWSPKNGKKITFVSEDCDFYFILKSNEKNDWKKSLFQTETKNS